MLLLGAGVFGGVYLLNSMSSTETTYVDLGEVKVNLADDNAKKYFKGNISLGYLKSDRSSKKQLVKEKQLVVAKDAVNFYFKSKKSDYLDDAANIDKIKDELISCINSNLHNAKVTDIKFSSFTVQ